MTTLRNRLDVEREALQEDVSTLRNRLDVEREALQEDVSTLRNRLDVERETRNDREIWWRSGYSSNKKLDERSKVNMDKK